MALSVDLGPAIQLPAGEVMRVSARQSGFSSDIAVVHTEEGEFYALDDECSHEAVPLSEGFVEDDTLECPRHGSAFNLKTGLPQTFPAVDPVNTHAIALQNDRLILYPGTPYAEHGPVCQKIQEAS